MKKSKYWLMVEELLSEERPFNGHQMDFLKNLQMHLDPYGAEDEIGPKAKKWLKWLHDTFVLKIEGDWKE